MAAAAANRATVPMNDSGKSGICRRYHAAGTRMSGANPVGKQEKKPGRESVTEPSSHDLLTPPKKVRSLRRRGMMLNPEGQPPVRKPIVRCESSWRKVDGNRTSARSKGNGFVTFETTKIRKAAAAIAAAFWISGESGGRKLFTRRG